MTYHIANADAIAYVCTIWENGISILNKRSVPHIKTGDETEYTQNGKQQYINKKQQQQKKN